MEKELKKMYSAYENGINPEQLNEILMYCFFAKKWKESEIHSFVASINYHYEQYCQMIENGETDYFKWITNEIERQKERLVNIEQ